MHELSVALALVELAESEALRLGQVKVIAVHLRLGPLAGIVEAALLFSFDVAAAGSTIEGARLEIEHEAVTGWCGTCADSRTLTSLHHRCCPACGQAMPDLIFGDSLELTALEIADDGPPDR